MDNPDVWKVCALCRHCHPTDSGREIPELIDSEYIVFRCDYYEEFTREDYLMIPVDEEIDTEPIRVCPHWEAIEEGDDDLDEDHDEDHDDSADDGTDESE
ncbi:hypothetical protein IJT17_03440 [bacterium]|nr:hypothetical protein [bacterium]